MNKKYSTIVDLNKFFAQCNLNMHIQFYNNHKRLVRNEIAKIDQKLAGQNLPADQLQKLPYTKTVYLTSYHQHMMINCFLTMYSHFEECLANTCNFFSKNMPESRRSGLERFKDHFKKEHCVKLADGPHWCFLCDCGKARNVLLHAAGNITLTRDRQEVEDLVKRNTVYFGIENSRIVPKEQLLMKFFKAIPDFTKWLTDQVK